MDYESIKSHFNVKSQNKNTCMALCPCHNDKKASLSISYDSVKRRTLIYCHAGCDIKDVLSRAGLKMRDLYEDDRPREFRDKASEDKDKPTNAVRGNIEAVYKYTDGEGRLLFEKIRLKPKDFIQRRYVDGAVVWGLGEGRYYETYPGSNEYSTKERINARYMDLPSTQPVLYNLPEVIRGVKEKKTIYIVEGEKDADNLIKHGLIATTNFDGASKSSGRQKWRKEYNSFLKGAEVVLIPDNDKAGICHMMNIAGQLKGLAKSVKLVELPVPPKGDVSLYLEEGHTIEEFLNLVKNTVHGGDHIKGENFSLLNYHFSDVGNAERLIALYGSDIRFSYIQQKFFIWSGRHWRMDNSGVIYKMAKNTLRRFLAEGEALDGEEDEAAMDLKKKVISFAIRSESDSRIRAMVNQVKSQPEVAFGDSDMDPFLLNTANGTLDLRTGNLREHRRQDYITHMIDIEYDQDAKCRNWLAFLDKIFLGDKMLVDYVQKSIGYSLTASQEEQCFYMLFGAGANGKTTFLNTMKMMMGDYAATLRSTSLMTRQHDDGARGDVAKLKNKRFVVSSELNEGQNFDESLLKCIAGGETIPVRFLYGEEFDLKPEFKLWIGTNGKPRIRETCPGIWRKVRMIPFMYTFSEEERDKNFMEKFIVPELPGILAWAVEGCIKWQKEGASLPEKVGAAVEEYRDEMDVVQRFLDERCVTGDIYNIRVGDLYQKFCIWCSRSGERTMSSVMLTKKLKEKGFEQYKSNGWRYWRGLATFKFSSQGSGL